MEAQSMKASLIMGKWFFHSLVLRVVHSKNNLPKQLKYVCAKSLQSCRSLQPHRRQPTRLPRPWDSLSKNTGVGCHFLLQCMKVKSESEDAQSCPTLSNPMDCSLPGSSVHGILQARQWSELPCCPLGDLPDPGIEPMSFLSPELAGRFFTALPPRKPTEVWK